MPKKVKHGKKQLKDVSVDEFMKADFESSDEEVQEIKTIARGKSDGKRPVDKTSNQPESEGDSEENEDDDQEEEGEGEDDAKKHKRDLINLKEKDPEFYKFLTKNDKALLDFDASDSSDEDGEEGGGAHIPNADDLEIASDASADEDEEVADRSTGKTVTVTMAQVNSWTKQLQGDKLDSKVLQEIVEAFRAAVAEVEDKMKSTDANYKVVGSAMFNAVIRMCVVNIPKALNKHINLPKAKSDEIVSASSCKKWCKVEMHVKKYLEALLQVVLSVADPDIVAVLLKHIYQMVPYITASKKFLKGFVKKLVMFWSSGEETVRVLAFLSLVKITRGLPLALYTFVLKTMYISYVKSCKFTSPSTWPLINFMKRSLVEIFALNDVQAYQYGFVYIRQLAIHLRNAITVTNKDCLKAVYNWQFVHCINFWAQLLSSLPNSQVLAPLVYPLVQTILGTIKLSPTEKNYPLRFHCLRALTSLSRATGTFIPVLPFLTEVFTLTDFNKKSLKSSWKPLNFMCMLKLSKAEVTEQGFRDGVIEQLFDLFVEYLNVESHRIGFPELVLPTTLQLKQFVKNCKVGNYAKQVNVIIDKMVENSKFIANRRKTLTIGLGDSKAIGAWETQCQLDGTPISRYYVNYKKVKAQEMLRKTTKGDKNADAMIPQVNRRDLMDKHKAKDRLDYTNLFTNDDDEADDSDTDFFSTKPSTSKKGEAAEGGDDGDDKDCTDMHISDSENESNDED